MITSRSLQLAIHRSLITQYLCGYCRGVASPDCPGGQSWWASRWRLSTNCALARTGGVWGGMCPPQKLEDFGILILNSRNLVITFTQKVPFFPPFPLPFSPFFSSLLFSFPFLFLFFFPFSFSLSFSLSLSLLPSLFSFLFLSLFFLSFPPFSPSRFLLSFPIFGVCPPAPPLATPLGYCKLEYLCYLAVTACAVAPVTVKLQSTFKGIPTCSSHQEVLCYTRPT